MMSWVWMDMGLLISISFFSIFLLIHYEKLKFSHRDILKLSLYLGAISLLIPMRNLTLGDGSYLLEMLVIESKLWGNLISIDELGEAFFHSQLFHILDDPLLTYRVISFFCGLGVLSWVYFSIKKQFIQSYHAWVIVFSGGMLLFHSYIENYSIVSLAIWSVMIFGYSSLKENQSPWANFNSSKKVFIITILSLIAVSMHLVAGYLLPSLIFYCYQVSKKEQFFKNSILAILISSLWLGGLAYLIQGDSHPSFWSGSHLFNPPILPIKKIFSTQHFIQWIQTLFFACFPAILAIFTLDQERWNKIKSSPENQFLCLMAGGFLLHTWIHNPMLGFPRDWDLFSFPWIPISFLIASSLQKIDKDYKLVFAYSLIFYLFQTIWIFENKLKEYEEAHPISIQYYHEIKADPFFLKLPMESRKDFIKYDYFLYRNYLRIQNLPPSNGKVIQAELGVEYREELREAIITPEDQRFHHLIRKIEVWNFENTKLL
jgi:hypothetical protein